MRILASNPDTIGDMVLRQPLYRALIDRGHELTLIVRKSVEGIARLIAPEAKLLVLPAEVYGAVDEQWEAFESIVAEARAAAPELLLIAPFQWTRFEERLAASLRDLPGLQVAGMSGRLYGGDPFAGATRPSDLTLDRTLAVDEDVPEADKNAMLADMLGCPVSSVEPVLTPDETSHAVAAALLAERGLAPGEYWIACVTGTANVPIKAWPPDQWAQVLKQWHERYGRRFLFVGLPAERSVVDLVLAGMDDAAAGSAVWMEPDGSVNTLAALAAASQGYVGHDTGPMHITAAAGKPVLAIFGGGHKLRFVPRVTPSVVLSVRVPCAGCGWACSFEKAHCVQSLRPVDVLRAVEDLEVGRIVGQDIRLLPLPVDVHDAMTAYAADLARERLRLLASAQRQLDAVDPQAIVRLTLDRDDKAHNAEDLSRQLSVVSKEVRRLQDAAQNLQEQSADLSRQLQDREQAVGELRQAIEEANGRTAVEAAARKSEVEPLRKEVDQLRHKLSAMEAATPAVAVARGPRTWRELFVDIVCGKRHYQPRRGRRPLPRICLVTRVLDRELDENVRRTVDSVLAEGYPHLEYILTAANPEREVVEGYAGRVTKITTLGDRPFAAASDAFAQSDADLVAWLDVGQGYEPGALFRIGEYFRDHSLAIAAVFEQTDGRYQTRTPHLTVPSLRHFPQVHRETHVVFRRQAYSLLGPLNLDKKSAAWWDLVIRFARRFGIRKGNSHSIANFHFVLPWPNQEGDQKAALESFEATYGWLGKLRSGVLQELHKWRRVFLKGSRRSFGTEWQPVDSRYDPLPAQLEVATTDDRVDAPSDPLATVVNPISHRRPTRLLFSASDIASDETTLHRVYIDDRDNTTVAAPALDGPALQSLLARRIRLAGSEVTAPEHKTVSPFRGFRAGPLWTRFIASLPCPYWRLAGTKAGEQTAVDRMLSLVGNSVAPNERIRALVIGCHDGRDLDALKAQTKWTLTGLETNPAAADAAEAKGHRVFRCNPQDAFMTLPDCEVFDLIFVPSMLEHWDDPAWVLRRLLRVLTPTGRIVVRTPNLDSMLLRRFGPTWWHWQTPYHRILFGRRGLRLLAAAVDMKVERLKTVTDAYAAAASVQLNEIGLAGIVPEGAVFEKRIARRGAKWAGWARMLWDRWGRGDEMWAVLRPE